MLKSGLTVWCYTLPAASQPSVVGYGRTLENIEITSAAPGGFGTLRATAKITDARLPHPELALFSRVAVMGHGENGPRCVWLGEIMDAPLVLSTSDGEVVEISALGIGNCLRDDPLSFAYSGLSAQQIAIDQLTGATSGAPVSWRAQAWPLDQDSSALFPDNPSGAYSLSYTSRNGEEVLGDICALAGDYVWGTRSHATHTDAAGFPTGQLYAQARNTATTAYQASLLARDITAYHVTPSSDRAYNVIKITYYDPNSGALGTATASDSRLGASGAQGSAPFRRRTFVRAMEGISTVTATQAQTLANNILAGYENVSNKVSLTLARVRNAAGIQIPLWAVAPGPAANIFVPELAVRGAQLVTGATAGVNQFFIVSATYREGGFSSSGGSTYTMELQLDCDNYTDQSATTQARLQLLADALSRVQRTTGTGTALGAQVKGWYEVLGEAGAAGQAFSTGVTYPNVPLTQTPTSVTLSSVYSNNNTSLRSASLGVYGFNVLITSSAAGIAENNGTYLTNGNCLYEVDLARGTFAHHCSGTFWLDRAAQIGRACDTTRRGLVMGRDTQTHTDEAGRVALTVSCPVCGSVEVFNTALGPEREEPEEHGDHHGAQQARAIRALMRHPALGLHHVVRGCRCEACCDGAAAGGGEAGEMGDGQHGEHGQDGQDGQPQRGRSRRKGRQLAQQDQRPVRTAVRSARRDAEPDGAADRARQRHPVVGRTGGGAGTAPTANASERDHVGGGDQRAHGDSDGVRD